MNDLDRKIQAALRRGDSELTREEPNLAEEVVTAFLGRYRWLSTLMVLETVLAVAVFVWCAVQFYQASEVTAQLRWGGLGMVALLVAAMIKLWFWLELQTNRVLREVKRLELLFVARSGRSGECGPAPTSPASG